MDPNTKMTKEQMDQIGLKVSGSDYGFPDPAASYRIISRLGFSKFSDQAKKFFKGTDYFKENFKAAKGKQAKTKFARPMFSREQENKFRAQNREKQDATRKGELPKIEAELAKAIEEGDFKKVMMLPNKIVELSLSADEFIKFRKDEQKRDSREYKSQLGEVRRIYGARSKELEDFKKKEIPTWMSVQERKKAAVKASRQEASKVRVDKGKAETAAKKQGVIDRRVARQEARAIKDEAKRKRIEEREAKKREKEAKKKKQKTDREVKRAEKKGDTVRARAIKVARPRKDATDVPPPPPKGPRPVDMAAIDALLSNILGKK